MHRAACTTRSGPSTGSGVTVYCNAPPGSLAEASLLSSDPMTPADLVLLLPLALLAAFAVALWRCAALAQWTLAFRPDTRAAERGAPGRSPHSSPPAPTRSGAFLRGGAVAPNGLPAQGRLLPVRCRVALHPHAGTVAAPTARRFVSPCRGHGACTRLAEAASARNPAESGTCAAPGCQSPNLSPTR